MNEEMALLESAEEIDSSIGGLIRESGLLEKGIERIEAEIAARKQDLDDLAARLKKAGMKRRKLESDLKEAEERVKSCTARLNQARNPREAGLLEQELAVASEKSEHLEEEALAAMDLEEKIGGKKEKSTADFDAWLPGRRDEIGRFSSMLNEKQGLKSDLEQERIAALNRMPGELRDTYEWLVKHHGRGYTLARLDGTACSGCGNVVVPALAGRVNRGELVRCSNCSRFLLKK